MAPRSACKKMQDSGLLYAPVMLTVACIYRPPGMRKDYTRETLARVGRQERERGFQRSCYVGSQRWRG